MVDDFNAPERDVDTIEIDPPSFRSVRRGYDPEQVDAHVRSLLRELGDLHAASADQQRREVALHDALTTAREELRARRERDELALAEPGTEGERLISAARSAALEIRTRAQIEANDIIKLANDEVRAVRSDAEQLVVRRSREADEAATIRVREANEAVRHAHERAEVLRTQTEQRAAASLDAARSRAQSLVAEAEAVRARAIADADALAAEARDRGRELIDEAREVRERLVGELSRRRSKLRIQVEQLQAGRDRLLTAYQVVRDALDEATVELDVALPDARDAAQAAALRAETEPDDVLDDALIRLRAEPPHDRRELAIITGEHPVTTQGDAHLAELHQVDELGDLTGAPDTAAETVNLRDGLAEISPRVEDGRDDETLVALDEPAYPEPATIVEDGAGEDLDDRSVPDAAVDEDASVLLAELDERDEAEAAFRRSARAPDPVKGRWSSAVRIIARPDPDDTEPVDDGSSSGDGDDPDEAPSEPGSETASAAPSDAGAGSHDGARATVEPEDSVLLAPIGELVGHADIARDEQQAMPEPRLSALLMGSVRGGDEENPSADGGGDAQDELDPLSVLSVRRDTAIAVPRRLLRRRLKSVLVGEENELLHAIREATTGVPKAHEVLPAEGEHRARFVAAAQPGLLAASVAGQELGAQLAIDEARRRVPGAAGGQLLGPTDVDAATIDALADQLAAELAIELRARLAACFPVGPPTTADPRVERTARDELITAVRSAYRSTKAGFVDRVSDRAITEAAHRAVRSQIPVGVQPSGVDVAVAFPVSSGSGR